MLLALFESLLQSAQAVHAVRHATSEAKLGAARLAPAACTPVNYTLLGVRLAHSAEALHAVSAALEPK